MGQKVFKCLIVDDDHSAHTTVEAHIIRTKGFELEDNAYDGNEALSLLSSKKFDVLFLDIEMPRLSGIELMEVLPYRPAIIVTSAYTEYAFEAYQNFAIDYLQKPILYERFLVAIEKAKAFLERNSDAYQYEFLELNSVRKKIVIQVKDVVSVQSLGNYVKVFIQHETKPIIAYSALKDIKDKLPGSEFLQVHRSFIVRKSFIEKKEKLDLFLKNGDIIPVGSKFDYMVDKFI